MSIIEEQFNRDIETIQRDIQYRFSDVKLLSIALTHRSFTNENPGAGCDNERLEFLGDAVLELVVSQDLFERFPTMEEGELSRARAHVVRAVALAEAAEELGLGEKVFLGKGEAATGGRHKVSVLANVLEAIFGAVYLDGGLDPVRSVVRSCLQDRLARPGDDLTKLDPKSRLQEWAQDQRMPAPTYALTGETGMDHDKVFRVDVSICDVCLGSGSGRSKKEAASEAARSVIQRLEAGEDLAAYVHRTSETLMSLSCQGCDD